MAFRQSRFFSVLFSASILALSLLAAACSQERVVQLREKNGDLKVPSAPKDKSGGTTTPSDDSDTPQPTPPVGPTPSPTPAPTPADPLPTPRPSPEPTPEPTPEPKLRSMRFACATSIDVATFNGFVGDETLGSGLKIYDVNRRDPTESGLPGELLTDFRAPYPAYATRETLVFFARASRSSTFGESSNYMIVADLLYRNGMAYRSPALPSIGSSAQSRAASLGMALSNVGGMSAFKTMIIPGSGNYELRTLPPEFRKVGQINLSPKTNLNPRLIADDQLVFDSFENGVFQVKRFKVTSESGKISVKAAAFPKAGGGDQIYPVILREGVWAWMNYSSKKRSIEVWSESHGRISRFDVGGGVNAPASLGVIQYFGKPALVVGSEKIRRIESIGGWRLDRGEFEVYSEDGNKLGVIPYPAEISESVKTAFELQVPILRGGWQVGNTFFPTLLSRYGRLPFKFSDETGVRRLTSLTCYSSIHAVEEAL